MWGQCTFSRIDFEKLKKKSNNKDTYNIQNLLAIGKKKLKKSKSGWCTILCKFSGVQQSDAVVYIHIHVSRFFSVLGYFKLLNIVPWGI